MLRKDVFPGRKKKRTRHFEDASVIHIKPLNIWYALRLLISRLSSALDNRLYFYPVITLLKKIREASRLTYYKLMFCNLTDIRAERQYFSTWKLMHDTFL